LFCKSFFLRFPEVGSNTNPMMLNVIVQTTVIALLGPGAFSIDARRFGRREILIPHTPPRPKP